MIYFTADTHFGHENILKYCNRPFKNARVMDNVIINNYNSIVNCDDTVYFLGDFSLKSSDHKTYLEKIVNKLNGKKILILGNHDKLKPFDYIDLGFNSVHTSLFIDVYDNQKDIIYNLFLVHDPAVSIIHNGWCLCGHVHTFFQRYKRTINVGVDMWDFKPNSMSIILDIIRNEK